MQAPTTATGQEQFRLPILSKIIAAIWFLVTLLIHRYGLAYGLQWCCLISCGFMLVSVNKAVGDQIKVNFHRKKVEKHQETASGHGESEFGKQKEIDDNELFSKTKGLYLGTTEDDCGKAHALRLNGRRNILVNAPPGAFKTMGIVMCMILADIMESFVMFDPACEGITISREYLERRNYTVLVLGPHIDEIKDITQMYDLEDIGIDVFSSITQGMSAAKIRSKLRAISERVIPFPKGMNKEQEFFYAGAQKIFRYWAWKEIEAGHHPTMAAISEQVMQGIDHLRRCFDEDQAEIEELVSPTAYQLVVLRMAKAYGSILRTSGEQFAGGAEILEQIMEHYAVDSEEGIHTSHCHFDFRELKNPNKKIALFICYPLEYLFSHADQISMKLTHIWDTLATSRQPGGCTTIVDECGALSLVRLTSNLEEYRKVGIRNVLIFQDILGQATRHYGNDGMESLLASCQVKIAIGVQQPKALKMFSELCGTQVIESSNLTDRSSPEGSMPHLITGKSHQSAPLARQEEIRLLEKYKYLMISEGMKPIKVNFIPYFENEKWRREAGVSPYYRGET